jgi:hypothetical protein
VKAAGYAAGSASWRALTSTPACCSRPLDVDDGEPINGVVAVDDAVAVARAGVHGFDAPGSVGVCIAPSTVGAVGVACPIHLNVANVPSAEVQLAELL